MGAKTKGAPQNHSPTPKSVTSSQSNSHARHQVTAPAPNSWARGHRGFEPHTRSPQQKKQRWTPSAPMEGHLAPTAEANGAGGLQQNETKRQDRPPAAFRPLCFLPPSSPMWAEGASEHGLPVGLVSLLPHPTLTTNPQQWLHPSTQHSARQDLMCDFSTLRPFSFHNSEAAAKWHHSQRVLGHPQPTWSS